MLHSKPESARTSATSRPTTSATSSLQDGVALTGHALIRQSRPRFPVVRYTADRKFVPAERGDDLRGTYLLNGAVHPLRLHAKPDVGHVAAVLASRQPLVTLSGISSRSRTL